MRSTRQWTLVVKQRSLDPYWPPLTLYNMQVITRRGRKIPVFTYGYPGAHYTILYSHGNAVDCGLLRDVLIDMAINLRVNVVAYDYTGYGSSTHVGRPGEGDKAMLLLGRKRIQARPEARSAAAARKPRGIKGAISRLRRALARRDAPASEPASTRPARSNSASGNSATAGTDARGNRAASAGGAKEWSSEHSHHQHHHNQPVQAQPVSSSSLPPSQKEKLLLPSEADVYADADAVADWLLTTPFCPSYDRVILYGQSLGSGAAVYLACTRPAAGLVLHSGIASAMRVVTDSRALACLDIFDNLGRLNSSRNGGNTSTGPRKRSSGMMVRHAFVFHGQRDEEVPVAHGHALAAAIATSNTDTSRPFNCVSWYPPLAGHNDLAALYRHEYYSRMRSFLVSICSSGAAAANSGGAALSSSSALPGVQSMVTSAAAVRDEFQAYINAPVVHPHQLGAVGRRIGVSGGSGAVGMPAPRPLGSGGGSSGSNNALLTASTIPRRQSLRVQQSVSSTAYVYQYAGGNDVILPPGASASGVSTGATTSGSGAAHIVSAAAAAVPDRSARVGRTPRPGSAAAAAAVGAVASSPPINGASASDALASASLSHSAAAAAEDLPTAAVVERARDSTPSFSKASPASGAGVHDSHSAGGFGQSATGLPATASSGAAVDALIVTKATSAAEHSYPSAAASGAAPSGKRVMAMPRVNAGSSSGGSRHGTGPTPHHHYVLGATSAAATLPSGSGRPRGLLDAAVAASAATSTAPPSGASYT